MKKWSEKGKKKGEGNKKKRKKKKTFLIRAQNTLKLWFWKPHLKLILLSEFVRARSSLTVQ